ncbi:MAG: hypothetical protein KDI02_27755, partial [Anaerolineae bacterium]|nr:hypothetical protein [Anaerolineae bacterium]
MNYLVQHMLLVLNRNTGPTSSGWVGMVILVYAYCWAADPFVVFAAATITATEIRDELLQDGDCALREAIQSINTGVQFDQCGPGVHGQA